MRDEKYIADKLQNSLEETMDALAILNPILTSKEENFLLVNDHETGIVICSSQENLQCLCNSVKELYADGTFK